MTDRDGNGRFLTGNSGGGRPRGARSKFSEDFLQTLAVDFEAHSSAVIARVREQCPETRALLAAHRHDLGERLDGREPRGIRG